MLCINQTKLQHTTTGQSSISENQAGKLGWGLQNLVTSKVGKRLWLKTG